MLKRNEAVSAIGYDGASAVVDKTVLSLYENKTARELADKGFFRAATAAALYDRSMDDLEYIAKVYNQRSDFNYTADEMPRLFGCAAADKITRCVYL